MKRSLRTVSAGLMCLDKVTGGSVQVKARVEGLLSIPRASRMRLHFTPRSGVSNSRPGEGALEFGKSPDQSTSTNGGSTNTVSSSVAQGATSLSVTASIGPGYYILGSRNRASIDSAGRFQGDGEIVRVTSTGTTATLESPTKQAYDSGVNIRFITESIGVVGINNVVTGGEFHANPSSTSGVGAPWAVAFQTQIGLRVQDIAASGGRVDCIRTLLCQDFTFEGVRVSNCQTPESTATGIGYSFAVNWSNSGTIRNVSGLLSRHTIGFHRLCHNISVNGIHAIDTAWAFDIHDGGSNLSARGISTPYILFSDGVYRVPKNRAQVSVGNLSHVNLSSGVTLGRLKVGDVFINHQAENLIVESGECRRLWFLGVTVAASISTASFFRTSTLFLTRHGLCLSSSSDPGQTAIDANSALSTTRLGTNQAVVVNFDRVRIVGPSIAYSPSHGFDSRANYQGSYTDFTFRFEQTGRVKGGGSTGGSPIRIPGFGSTVTDPIRIELADLDLYAETGTSSLAATTDVTSGTINYAYENVNFSLNGGALNAISSSNMSTRFTTSTLVTDLA